jgi:CRISPR/Cas system-associated exonuclease Cas4 (RecB family)
VIINPQYQYPTLERVMIKEKRHYTTNKIDPLPSVTTILSSSGNKEALQKWIERVGEEEAEKIKNVSASVGTTMHSNIENYILHNTKPSGKPLEMILSKLIIDDLKNVDEVWGLESALYYPKKYAGTTDMVGIYKGIPAIIDFKNSRKMKLPKFLDDYKMQLVAYALAHNSMFGTTISNGVILIARWDGILQKVNLSGTEFDDYCEKWMNLVENYHLTMVNNI